MLNRVRLGGGFVSTQDEWLDAKERNECYAGEFAQTGDFNWHLTPPK